MVVFSEVLQKLKAADEYPYFIRHINGDTHDNRAENLAWVTLKNALMNISTWKVDWVIYLNEEEIRMVKELFTRPSESGAASPSFYNVLCPDQF